MSRVLEATGKVSIEKDGERNRGGIEIEKCERPNCDNLVIGSWDRAGRFCSNCVMEAELFDKEERWNYLSI